MSIAIFDELKNYVGFDENDELRMKSLGPVVSPCLPEVVDRFYETILRHPGARVVFGDVAQVRRLRVSLLDWLQTLFCGRYDAEYYQKRSAIGRVHVRVGLPQHYMFGAMEIIWQSLKEIIYAADIANPREELASLHKLLSLELGIMLEAYKESYSEEIRRIERESMHERLTRAEHLAEIGQLAASLAHEIKNPLAGISGAIQVLRDGLARDDGRRSVLDEVLRHIARLDNTVKDLLVYARPKPVRVRECELNRVVERVLTLIRESPDAKRVVIEYIGDRHFPMIAADENLLEDVLLNLLQNAIHASPPGARVIITARVADGFAELAVEDFGHGMDEAVQRRAMEPFFTTKARGTGLGLSICQQIAAAHGGVLHIQSRPGAGTTVTLRVPSRGNQERDRVSP
ncbi:MAG: hypothetical protein JNG88_07650 [Phycisphaerales bacterium]|nr:hypothetical protein [Phycisphaerales bacterium]